MYSRNNTAFRLHFCTVIQYSMSCSTFALFCKEVRGSKGKCRVPYTFIRRGVLVREDTYFGPLVYTCTYTYICTYTYRCKYTHTYISVGGGGGKGAAVPQAEQQSVSIGQIF